jgi:hypothetical protein
MITTTTTGNGGGIAAASGRLRLGDAVPVAHSSVAHLEQNGAAAGLALDLDTVSALDEAG